MDPNQSSLAAGGLTLITGIGGYAVNRRSVDAWYQTRSGARRDQPNRPR